MKQIETNQPSTMVIIIRPALKLACCEGDPCRAAILNQLLYFISQTHKRGRDYWYGSVRDITDNFLDGSWGDKKVGQEINTLVQQGFIARRHNPKFKWDRTYQYQFESEQATKFIEACDKFNVCVAHHMGFNPDVLNFLKQKGAINVCKCEDTQPTLTTQQQRKAPQKLTAQRITELQTMPYSEYLKTPEWAEKRKKALRFARFRCQLCNSPNKLNTHHRSYQNIGNEPLGDLIVLCEDCHAIFHQNRDVE